MKTVTLNNGVEMPVLGFGTYQITESAECERSVLEAIETGYRLIDTAQAYGNEEAVGNAIKKCGVPRQELFIVTKVWFKSYEYEEAKASVLESMRKLQTNYLDLVLLHQPFGNTYAGYRALENLYKEGKLRAIGISNFASDRMIDLINFNEIVPQVNQVETHLAFQQEKAQGWMEKYHVQHQAWAPLAQGHGGKMLAHPTITDIAAKYGKTPAQISLRFQIQRGIVVIPKSTRKERIDENFNIFDFALTEEELEKIKAIDTNQPIFGSHQDPEFVEMAMSW